MDSSRLAVRVLLIAATLDCFRSVHTTSVTLSRSNRYELEGHNTSYTCEVESEREFEEWYAVWILGNVSSEPTRKGFKSWTWHRVLRRDLTGSMLTCLVHPINKNATLELNVRIKNPPYNISLGVNAVKFCVGDANSDPNCSANVTIGRHYRFACNTSGFSPASDIIWWINSTELQDAVQSNRVKEGDRINSSQILLQITPAYRHSSITCTVLFPNDTFQQLSLKLLVMNEQVITTDTNGTRPPCLTEDSRRNVSYYVVVAVPTSTIVFGFVFVVLVCKLRANHLRPHKNENSPEQTEYRLASEEVDVKDFTFPSDKITLQEVLGSGHFGQVYKATADGILEEGVETVVAVKVLKVSAICDAVADFEKEIATHKTLKKHPNVVSMLGYCTDSAPSYLILEYLPGGTLQQYLRSKRESWKQATDEGAFPASPSQLLTFASQIASGMEYLSSVGCIHRDLAARNVLLDGELVCKLCDFGLARDVSDKEEYEMTSLGMIPVRWLAIECLVHDKYTTKSDVWSFGVLLWEIITLGARPYHGMHANEVIDSIVKGYRLPPPVHCGGELYSIMEDVWRELPYRRPTFRDLKRTIDRMIPKAQVHLDMVNFEADKYVTN